jgi:hypothetical protein
MHAEVFIKKSGRARWLGLFPDVAGRVGDVWFWPELGYHWNERIEVDLLDAGKISELIENPYFTGYHGYSAKLPDLHSILSLEVLELDTLFYGEHATSMLHRPFPTY